MALFLPPLALCTTIIMAAHVFARLSASDTVAELMLYPGSRVHPLDIANMVDLRQHLAPCPTEAKTKILALALDTCLSGEYYLQANFRITQLSTCRDGSLPTARFYQRRRCVGDFLTPDISGDRNACLWSHAQIPNPSYYWSLLFTCGDSGSTPDWKHQEAKPPSIFGQRIARSSGHLALFDKKIMLCDWWFLYSGMTSELNTLPDSFDKCRWAKEYVPVLTRYRIDVPAICPDGSRARLAWAKDVISDKPYLPCKIKKIILEEDVMDINDEDLGHCFGARATSSNPNDQGILRGLLFYCGGAVVAPVHRQLVPYGHLPVVEGFVSHQDAPANNHTGQTTRFFPVATGTCVNLPAGKSLAMYSNAVCNDKWPARFAVWRGPDCQGPPRSVRRNVLYNDNPLAEVQSEVMSYSFWCDGTEGVLKTAEREGLAVYSDDACSYQWDIDSGYSPPNPPPLHLVELGSCFRGKTGDWEWQVFKNISCPDGRTAKLGLWSNPNCDGSAVSVDTPPKAGLCPLMCPGLKYGEKCSRAFVCDESLDGIADKTLSLVLQDASSAANSSGNRKSWLFWMIGAFIALLLVVPFRRFIRHRRLSFVALQQRWQ